MRRSQISSHPYLNFSFSFIFYVGKMAFRSQRESPSNHGSPRQPAPCGLRTWAQTQPSSSFSHKLAIGKSVWHTRGVGNSSDGVRSWYLQAHRKYFIWCLSKYWAVTPSQKLMAGQLGQMSTKPSHGFPLPKFCDHPSWQFLGEDWAPSCGLAASVSITCNGCSQVINGSGVQKGNTGKRQRGNSLALLHGVTQWQRKK